MPKRILQGLVVSDKGEKTVVVKVTRRVPHPKYKKIVSITKNYHAHDENNDYKQGDVVQIVESKPFSKTKKWQVIDDKAA
jgi:small subunit ribosomal protein S17